MKAQQARPIVLSLFFFFLSSFLSRNSGRLVSLRNHSGEMSVRPNHLHPPSASNVFFLRPQARYLVVELCRFNGQNLLTGDTLEAYVFGCRLCQGDVPL